MLRSPQEILCYWFGEHWADKNKLNTVEYIQSRMPLWFGRASPVFDDVQLQNADLIDYISLLVDGNSVSSESNLEGDWSSPEGLLATIVVLDQFPRSVYRGTAKAFVADSLVLLAAKQLLQISELPTTASSETEILTPDDGVLCGGAGYRSFAAIERFFVVVAIQHSEVLRAQELGVWLASCLAHDAPSDTQNFFKNLKGFPMEHHDVIARFGRFPSRNDALVSGLHRLSHLAICFYLILFYLSIEQ